MQRVNIGAVSLRIRSSSHHGIALNRPPVTKARGYVRYVTVLLGWLVGYYFWWIRIVLMLGGSYTTTPPLLTTHNFQTGRRREFKNEMKWKKGGSSLTLGNIKRVKSSTEWDENTVLNDQVDVECCGSCSSWSTVRVRRTITAVGHETTDWTCYVFHLETPVREKGVKWQIKVTKDVLSSSLVLLALS